MITSRDIAETLLFVETQGLADTTVFVQKMTGYLKKHHSLHLLPEALRMVEEGARKEKERESVTITTPFDLSATVVKDIVKTIAPLAKEKPMVVLNKELIGGCTVEYGGVVYDASMKKGLELLQKQLTK